VSVVTNPHTLTGHRSSDIPFWPWTSCGLNAASWPHARHLRPSRFCSGCFTEHERELLTDILPELTEGDHE